MARKERDNSRMKKRLLAFWGAGLLLLSGCLGQSPGSRSDSPQPKEALYQKSVLSLSIEGAQVSDFQVTPDYLYFTAQEERAGAKEETPGRTVYRIRRQEGAKQEVCYRCWDDFFLDYVPVTDEQGESLCVLTVSGENYVIRRYGPAGDGLDYQDGVDIPNAVRRDAYLTDLIVGAGQGYLLWGKKEIQLLGEEGVCLHRVECPGESLQRAVRLTKDKVAFLYLGEHDEVFLTILDAQSGELSPAVSVSQMGLSEREGEVLLYDTAYLYEWDAVSKKAQKCLSLQAYSLPESWIRQIAAGRDGFTVVSYNEAAPDTVQIISLTDKAAAPQEQVGEAQAKEPETGRVDEQGRRIVTLYSAAPELLKMGITDEMLATFNLESEKYVVELYAGEKTLPMAAAGDDPPDILFEWAPEQMEDYLRNGYLEDLWPYIDASERLGRDDLQPQILRTFETDGKLYAIPRNVCVQTLLGRASQMPEKGWWSEEEFLSWLEERPEAATFWGHSPERILQYCVRGNLTNRYVDLETGTAYFDQPAFLQLLERIGALELSGPEGILPRIDLTGDTDYRALTYLYDCNVTQLDEIAKMEYLFGERMVDMGLPDDSGERRSILTSFSNLAVLANSRCKEGAYAFLEFCLLYRPAVNQAAGEPKKGEFWTARSVMAFDMEQTIGEQELIFGAGEDMETVRYPVTEQQAALFLGILDHAVPESRECRQIWAIVTEEAAPFFLGQTDAESACEKMQSRVRLLLQENR